MKTLTDITQYTEYVEKLNAMFDTEDDDDDIDVEEEPLNTYTKENFLADVYISEKQYDTLEGLLKKKLNVILQGAPGVGKTYAAKRLAYSMIRNVFSLSNSIKAIPMRISLRVSARQVRERTLRLRRAHFTTSAKKRPTIKKTSISLSLMKSTVVISARFSASCLC